MRAFPGDNAELGRSPYAYIFWIVELSGQRSYMQTKMCYNKDFLFKTSWSVVTMKSNILYISLKKLNVKNIIFSTKTL